MKIPNPFDTDPSFDHVRAKWGQPKMLEQRTNGFMYQCECCEASWVGPVGDWCDWCHERWIVQQEALRASILRPEWLSWGERFQTLSPIDQEVFASTRGFRGNYQSAWLIKLKECLLSTMISEADFVAALKRWERWKMNQPLKHSKESFEN